MHAKIPLIIHSSGPSTAAEWLLSKREVVQSMLDEAGAVLLRDFRVNTENDFKEAVEVVCERGIEYVYRSTPRTDLGNGIYTASEYPAGLTIPFHNENSYQHQWPLLLLFCCLQPAEGGGGQTPLADTLNVTSRIPDDISKVFSEKRLMYIRNYNEDIDIPWKVVFQTESRAEVEVFCTEHAIAYEWTDRGELRTKQICDAFARHPRTGAILWFNQAHLFHPSSLDKKTRSLLSRMFKEEEFPRNVTYGDGSPLDEAMLDEIRHAFAQEAVHFKWQRGDILILDNMRISHARTPYTGNRRVLVAMGRPVGAVLTTTS